MKRTSSEILSTCHVRVARPTSQLESVTEFYRVVLGFETIGAFRDHDGFDGVMMGHPGMPYHLEFTCEAGEAMSPPSKEHLLVFYVFDEKEWRRVTDEIESHGVRPVTSHNPYWDHSGRTYEDPDGYRVVIQNGSWPPDHGNA